MSDSRRVYTAISQAVKQLYPNEPQGTLARHLNTLAAMTPGIVLSKTTHLPKVATKVPGPTKPLSRVKKYERWIRNDAIASQVYFLPFVQDLLTGLAGLRTLVLVMDGSEVGRGCLALLVSVVYQGRALPLAGVVVKGRKGHFPAQTHVALLAQVTPLLPAEAEVVFLGDGEFAGIGLQAAVEAEGYAYVCRTASNILVYHEDVWRPVRAMEVEKGECLMWSGVGFTQANYGPVQVIAWWEAGYAEPLYLVTNLASKEEACGWYRKRAHIETFFSDQKSRGFQLHKSHLADPARLARLMIAACLGYLWLIYLGALAMRTHWCKVIHRTDRCDLSLFQLGLRLLDHFLDEALPLPVAFQPAPARSKVVTLKSVR
jgi:hypothetical protein